jgi:sulfur carrier protein
MKISMNQRAVELADDASIADALAAFDAKPPFAVAVNGQFVARARYISHPLAEGDRLDVVQPVAGG